MDISMLIQFFQEVPGSQFIAGLLLGFLLRSYLSGHRAKRKGRYAALSSSRRTISVPVATANEPYFDWADAAVKTFTGRRNVPLVEQVEDN